MGQPGRHEEEWNIRTPWDLLGQHDRDLYRGNGKPGLTTRMQQAEDRLDGIDGKDGRMDKCEQSLDSTRKLFWALVMLALSNLTGIVVILVTRH